MKKIIAVTILATFLISTVNAQLSKLKQKRDDTEATMQATSAENMEGWQAVNNPQEDFDKYIFKVTDYAPEGDLERVQKALAIAQIEKAYANTTWKFYNDGELNFTNINLSEFTFKINNGNININTKQGNLQVKLFTKGDLYRLRVVEENNTPVNLVLQPTEKKGFDLFSQKELRTYSLAFIGSNGDLFMLKQSPCFTEAGENRRMFYNLTKDGKFEWYNYIWHNGFDSELEYTSIPISNLNISAANIAFNGDMGSYVNIPVTGGYIVKKYKKEGIIDETKTALGYGEFSFAVKQAFSLLENIAKALPADKRAAFEKNKAKVAAEVNVQDGKEKAAWAKIEAENAKKREKLATISFWNKKDINCTIYDDGNPANGCMPASYSFKSSRSKTVTFCVGTTVRIGCTGHTFIVTKAMDGKSIDF